MLSWGGLTSQENIFSSYEVVHLIKLILRCVLSLEVNPLNDFFYNPSYELVSSACPSLKITIFSSVESF
jgi:hypothetical protein